MAVSKRNTASSHTQEPPLTIARVALYARVSTLNGQDPEMQLSRTPGVRFPPRLDHHQRVRRSGRVRLKGIATGTESAHGRRSPAEVRCRAGVEDRSLRSFAEASGQRPRGSLRLRSGLCQLPRQPRPQHTFRPSDVSDHRRHGRVRAVADPGAGQGRVAQCTRQGQEVRKAPRPG